MLVCPVTGLAFNMLKIAASGRKSIPRLLKLFDTVKSSWLIRSLYSVPGSLSRTFTVACVSAGSCARLT